MVHFMDFNEGLAELTREKSPQEIGIVEISSRLGNDLMTDSIVSKIESISPGKISQENLYYYSPPDTVGNRRKCFWLPEEERRRIEQIPTIISPNLTYIILDDVIETGGTLSCAVRRLEEQGVKRENMWFWTMQMMYLIGGGDRGYVDKVQKLYDFLDEVGDRLS